MFGDLYIDRNNDFWASSANSGIFKISDEPFTKIDLHPVYQDPLISFIYRSAKNEIFISNFDGKTAYSSYQLPGFKSFDIRLYAQTNFRGQIVFGCENGVVYFDGKNFRPYKNLKTGERVLFVFAHGDKLYYCPEGQGLHCYDAASSKKYKVLDRNLASHIYTAQINKDQSKIYFGTNDGIFELKTGSGEISKISSFPARGSYAGISCTDSYGTMWFSFDKKLVGITEREDYLVIEDKKYFNSTLFYNLNSDPYGNLIIGTNVGVTKLKIDHLGNVINCFHYNNNNGFGGFETHMRSNFQDGKYIYLGTIEGLFAINTEKLEYLPNPPLPLIFQLKEKDNTLFNSDEELIKISYLALNPKLNGIQYTYRLKGKTKAWSELTPKTEAYFSNLSDQEYIFQVRSTYDGMNFSPVASYKIVKDTPFWKSKWFILFLILSIALANVIVLDRSKSFELSYIIENQNLEINSRVRSLILAFGFLANTGANYLAPFLEGSLPRMNGLNTLTGITLFLLFLLSVFRHPFPKLNKYLLQIGLFVVVGQCYIGAYLSEIHPFYVTVISLTTAFTPFVLNRIFEVIILSVFHVLSAISIVFLVDHSIFNEVLFIIAIMVSICLSIFTTYIRNESLQKLVFISGIINRGNIVAIAFNQENKITYISENSYASLGINPNDFLNKSISSLNRFVDQELSKRTIDLAHEFKDEQKHIIPMKKGDAESVNWVEWSCKVFSKKIKVIFGQDISERVTIENNYESLVENAQDLIYYVDINGNFVYVNNKFQEILGFEESELIGRDSMFIVNVFQQPAVRKFYEEQFRNRTLNTYNEIIIRKKDGTEIWVGQNTTLLYAFGSNKIIKGFLCIARDITEKRNQQKVIEAQHEDITSSINYAKTIQYNLLPDQSKIEHCFADFSVFYQPKDIVSGDFYWFERQANKTIFVLSDCTGHGVPGAFMTLLGINLINQIINEDKVLNPGKILGKMDEKLVGILPRQGNSNLRDGMEMLVLIYDHQKNSCQYACAGGKFMTYSEEGFVIHRGESKHIGDSPEANFSKYNTYTLDVTEPKAFYFFSDGIQDQFSESTHKKFTLKRMLEILKKHPEAPMEEQVREIRSKLHKWKGNTEQTDDITFIGFRF